LKDYLPESRKSAESFYMTETSTHSTYHTQDQLWLKSSGYDVRKWFKRAGVSGKALTLGSRWVNKPIFQLSPNFALSTGCDNLFETR
jgi:hypothetical protein